MGPSGSTPSVPLAEPLDAVLSRCEPLQSLRQRLADSSRRFDAIAAVLPRELALLASSGPVDDSGWTLLASSSSAAAKLRQLKPRLEACLREKGFQVSAIRIRVQSASRPRL